jgi:peptide deformylase
MNLYLTYYGNAVLRTKGAKVETFDAKLKKLAAEMIEKMREWNGIGLAAQQVGKPIMLCVLDVTVREDETDFYYTIDGKTPPLNLIMPMALVNPALKLSKDETEMYNEGCLSFPKIYADVERPTALTCKYQDLEGAEHVLVCNGLLARVIQHEVDHLNGILFIDRMPKSTVKKLWPELEELKLKGPAL